MKKIIDIAKYIANKYFSEKNKSIDEMKLHKMTFFIQKEAFTRYTKPMFEEEILIKL